MEGFSKVVYVDNVGGAAAMFHNEILTALRDGTSLPEEIADLFTLTVVEVADGKRGVVGWV